MRIFIRRLTMNFAELKVRFDQENSNVSEYDCFLPVHLTHNNKTTFKKKDGSTTKEFYKWQFLYSLVNSGLVPKEYIGTDIHFPNGNKSLDAIKIDGAIFDDNKWFDYYKSYHQTGDMDSLEWLRKHLIAVIGLKKEDSKNIAEDWDKQLKAYLRESDREFCLGILYDVNRLYLFKKQGNKFLRFSDEYNTKGEESKTKELCLHLTDSYLNIPTFQQLLDASQPKEENLSNRTIFDLDIISGIHSTKINDVISHVLRTMDRVGLTNQRGFEVLIQILSLKIFDEKRNEKNNSRYLDFYITPNEKKYISLADENLQKFLERINQLKSEAASTYTRILKNDIFDSQNENHIKVLIEVISQFQNYSFVRSHKTDLYQLVFYKFATPFSKENNAQFVTPLPLIDFLVKIVNPRNGEAVIDPTVGIADFLSVSYINSNNSKSKLDDSNMFGMDIDEQMVMLATLNMLLNGDGNAKIEARSGYGSLLSKFDDKGGVLELIPAMNKNGNWDNRPDEKKLKKFDVVLTNPPFGDDRAFVPKDDRDKALIECYELWNLYGNNSFIENTDDEPVRNTKKAKEANKIDLGVVFLENAYRILAENGRMGIVLSNSIASIDSHRMARKWLMDKMRIVAIFDLPANVFAETGVNTSIIVAYKPRDEELKKLKDQNYEVFAKDIQKVGYEVKTSKRVKQFVPTYKIDYESFEIQIDDQGSPMLDEDFSQTIADFKAWCLSQEQTLQDLFIKAK